MWRCKRASTIRVDRWRGPTRSAWRRLSPSCRTSRQAMAKTVTGCRRCCAVSWPGDRQEHAFMHSDPQALAELAGKTMYERDPASQALGMTLDAIGPGYARMSMAVRRDMLNGHGTCHGGYIFMLADSAFAFACNSHNFNTVGAGCTI